MPFTGHIHSRQQKVETSRYHASGAVFLDASQSSLGSEGPGVQGGLDAGYLPMLIASELGLACPGTSPLACLFHKGFVGLGHPKITFVLIQLQRILAAECCNLIVRTFPSRLSLSSASTCCTNLVKGNLQRSSNPVESNTWSRSVPECSEQRMRLESSVLVPGCPCLLVF